jgi:5-enolpyruvylshikimate-3-phosphate synthase
MCGIAALRAEGPVGIEGSGAVDKSYPGFFDDLTSLGARVDEADHS